MSERGSGADLPDLGPRGEGWVVLQVALLLVVVATAALGPDWPRPWESPLLIVGVITLLAGVFFLLAGARSLGAALTPLPHPREAATLRDNGVYRFVRHPIYGGLLLIALGLSLCSSPWTLVPTAVLALLLVGKSVREERWLIERYPDYPAYRDRVPRRFLPFVW
ncbi:MAG: isoprenylcysteine carboxylmethyltransferase family protein [Actinomycetota bacterium]